MKRPRVPRSHPVHTAGATIYTCSGCETAFSWGPESAWFGSILEWDQGDPLAFACGDACREKVAAALGVSPEAILDLPDD